MVPEVVVAMLACARIGAPHNAVFGGFALEAVRERIRVSHAKAMGAEQPLFILYTSGSTARPKGIVRTTGGYLTGVSATHRYVFDLDPEDRELGRIATLRDARQ